MTTDLFSSLLASVCIIWSCFAFLLVQVSWKLSFNVYCPLHIITRPSGWFSIMVFPPKELLCSLYKYALQSICPPLVSSFSNSAVMCVSFPCLFLIFHRLICLTWVHGFLLLANVGTAYVITLGRRPCQRWANIVLLIGPTVAQPLAASHWQPTICQRQTMLVQC